VYYEDAYQITLSRKYTIYRIFLDCILEDSRASLKLNRLRRRQMTRTSVLLADDHVMLMDGLVPLIRQEFDVVGVARDGRAMLEMARQYRPNVIVTDISMPHLNGIDAARILLKEASSAKLLFLSMHADLPLVEEAFRAGASGYLLKICSADEFVRAIQCVAKGTTYITPLLAGDLISNLLTAGTAETHRDAPLTLRQREVLQLLAEGKTMKEVAGQLGISTRTAESHKYEIMRQLGVQTTAALIRYAVRIKLV
jgi:DNA-binding NarL/FixJ family response regulator